MENSTTPKIQRPAELTVEAVNAAFRNGGLDAQLADQGDGNMVMTGRDINAANALLMGWMEEQNSVVTYYDHSDR
ncbi:hypothetical protein [Asaia bogorensis]|uniref:Uncharacterized protein n=1 Tax=Asaia bogorensis NBRC 16594 TaxID=1231624 RepID=A0AAN4R5W4_9PROT|nr:hypothetical protein [Asaia bogorensis]BAT19666.1 hypothetical protein Asbog_01393 [Asaia bogorensis NBRC 16594]GBQ78118.1 hypothetical protein AA0311_1659 [Asaia bogorensis NBRC 16594]GEL53836.1 hypothetical protein ABO01nite_18430 [Asaia bogorensis NBRC 16594]